MATKEIKTPQNPKLPSKGSDSVKNGVSTDTIISPRFRSVAAMAGWDEEALLLASLFVEDTPERESKHKKRVNLQFSTPPTSSRRKRKVQRQSPTSIPIVVLNLDDDEETVREENDTEKMESKMDEIKEKKIEKDGRCDLPENGSVSSFGPSLLCIDRLREELSCAICLEICFEPSTTPCGHSFCKKCLKYAADKCGKRCPKCRQLFSNGRSCTVNTVLWNTIQLLFPQEVEARKVAGAISSRESARRSPENENYNLRHGSTRSSTVILMSRGDSARRRRQVPSQAEDAALALRSQSSTVMGRDDSARRRRRVPSQAEDAALALRLQREEFMEAFGRTQEQSRTSASSARDNLRAMASRAINLRIRGWNA